MKAGTSSSCVSALLAIAALSSLARTAATCERAGNGTSRYMYDIEASGVANVDRVCADLSVYLKQIEPKKCPVKASFCGPNQSGNLLWGIDVSSTCQGDILDRVWTKITGNKWGTLDCPN